MRTAPTNDAAGGHRPTDASSATGEQVAHSGTHGMSSVPAYFLAGAALLGVPGWALDQWLGTRAFVAVGVLAGFALAFYVIWVRYVGPATAAADDTHGGARPARSDEESA